MLFWRNQMFVVGPDSAGAHPGPACYRKGGPLTVTDANLFLGRLNIDTFPKSQLSLFAHAPLVVVTDTFSRLYSLRT